MKKSIPKFFANGSLKSLWLPHVILFSVLFGVLCVIATIQTLRIAYYLKRWKPNVPQAVFIMAAFTSLCTHLFVLHTTQKDSRFIKSKMHLASSRSMGIQRNFFSHHRFSSLWTQWHFWTECHLHSPPGSLVNSLQKYLSDREVWRADAYHKASGKTNVFLTKLKPIGTVTIIIWGILELAIDILRVLPSFDFSTIVVVYFLLCAIVGLTLIFGYLCYGRKLYNTFQKTANIGAKGPLKQVCPFKLAMNQLLFRLQSWHTVQLQHCYSLWSSTQLKSRWNPPSSTTRMQSCSTSHIGSSDQLRSSSVVWCCSSWEMHPNWYSIVLWHFDASKGRQVFTKWQCQQWN